MAAPGKVTPSRPWGLPGDACERGEFVESICARCPKVIVPELGWGALGQDAPLPQYLLHNFNIRLFTDESAAALWEKMFDPSASLSESEQSRAERAFTAIVVDLEDAWRQFELGSLPEAALNSRAPLMTRILGTQFGSEWWVRTRRFPDPTFLSWLDAWLGSDAQSAESPSPQNR